VRNESPDTSSVFVEVLQGCCRHGIFPERSRLESGLVPIGGG
jgi:hypothetical protein